ncbi:hypothetical protein SERLA73DRAFT_75076 [Serpula lacrymans var. lacrymans S7.3]|uniref:Uncharacterized protein n=1 Tax=Serpula lacrymans var. lacrymans (strain S7.3) TaxID=936435 RepID=F8Q2H4_SERL3|nr:hypothetical protein SERLA73DRAFT_75076 [Serpula lacrymans var. lacrymans S7.3]
MLERVGGLLFGRFGPVSQCHENSKYYSANRLVPNKDVDAALPHVTIELPVSKESLEQTIAPSVYSLKKAMQTYARQGETLVIFVHDDGIQLISEEKRQERIAFYAKHNIRWVARSKHDNTPGGSKRADPFKKVSNMNHGLALSSKLEKHLKVLENAVARNALAKDQSGCLEGKALQRKRETMDAMGLQWKRCVSSASASPKVILLIGNDGLRIVYEMLLVSSRNVQKLLSHSMNQMLCKLLAITSRMVFTHFTRRINKCISIGCANGEVTPFVWHDAFLRWTALQGAAFIDPADNFRLLPQSPSKTLNLGLSDAELSVPEIMKYGWLVPSSLLGLGTSGLHSSALGIAVF